jgi:membrane protease YdiL (CAAX protease family)
MHDITDAPPPPALAAAVPLADVPWSAREILLAIFLSLVLWPVCAWEMLSLGGFYRWYYGPDAADAALRADGGDEATLARARLGLWASFLAFPMQALTIPVVFSFGSGTRPRQLGLRADRLGRDLAWGLGVWALLTPPVLGLHQAILYLYRLRGGRGVEEHVLTRLAEQGLTPPEWFLWICQVAVAAPVLEEMLFRGALQRWFRKFAWGSDVAVGVALLCALAFRRQEIARAWENGAAALADALTPALFVLALVPVFLLVRRRWPGGAAPAIFGTSLLFAAVHTSAWPSPVALFVLALGLGTLAARTGSLAGPMLVHALFNATGCVQLLLFRQGG